MPIGIPLPGTHCFVNQNENDNDLEGELCVAGPAVMSGYWGMNDADADCWVDDPSGNENRAYRTGDLVSLGNNGNWMYHGRRDKMVKIRGYRVEIGEIESCLLTHQGVDLAAVIKRANKEYLGDELVAFIVPKEPDSDFSKVIQSIIKHCKHNLPAYMIPRKVYQLSSMPVNNSGKIDRLKLEEVALQYKNSES
jgi:acyl-coenzyme A synthetase/AMP-(fatty) acid ligase